MLKMMPNLSNNEEIHRANFIKNHSCHQLNSTNIIIAIVIILIVCVYMHCEFVFVTLDFWVSEFRHAFGCIHVCVSVYQC